MRILLQFFEDVEGFFVGENVGFHRKDIWVDSLWSIVLEKITSLNNSEKPWSIFEMSSKRL
mgnify:FL=1